MCYDMTKQIKEKKAPKKSMAPVLIDCEHLFSLDVDDDIWQDIGLDEHESEVVPGWLGDEKIREGIKALLTVTRCAEELARIKRECTALQEWSREEWQAINAAIVICGKFCDFILFDP